jgi:putative transposase
MNTFILNPGKEEAGILHDWADNCSRMYNEINYKRRQSFFNHNFNWNTDAEYYKYKGVIGSATAQQIIRKNNEAWKSFFALLEKRKKGELEDRPHPPGYWKDRTTGKRIPRILIRGDLYELGRKYLKLPFKFKVRWKGKNKWVGKQGRLEIVYDALEGQWICYMPVEVEPLHQPKGNKRAYIDLGVLNLITGWIEGEERAVIYSGRSILSDWWYWSEQIARCQEELDKIGKKSSKRLRELYRRRKRRFRQVVNTIIARFVAECYDKGVSEIVIGDVTNIRDSGSKGNKTNAMLNNFWSFSYIYERLRITAENYGIKMRKKREERTSKTCCLCGEEHRGGRRYRGLYICKEHGVPINADVNGVANISNPIFPKPIWDRDNWVVAHPLLHRIGVGTIAL